MYKKLTQSICILLLVIICIFGITSIFGNRHVQQKIVVGIAEDYAPFVFYERGSLVGFDIDMIRCLSKQMNKKIEFKIMPIVDFSPSLESGSIDIALSGLVSSTTILDSVELIPYTALLIGNEYCLMHFKDVPINEEENRIYNLGVESGTAESEFLKNNHKTTRLMQKLRPVPMRTKDEIMNAMRDNRVDAMLVPKFQFDIINAEYAEVFDCLKITDSSTQINNTYQIAIKKDSRISGSIKIALEEMKLNGDLDKIRIKWLIGSDVEVCQPQNDSKKL